jgi:hypothetical protein
MENTIEFEFKLRIANSIADGMSYRELMELYQLNYQQLRRYKDDPLFQQLVAEIVEDNHLSAYYRLVASSKIAVKELVSFLGNGELSDREQLTAINMVLSLTLDTDKKNRDNSKTTQIKGYTKKNVEDIKIAILGKPPSQ